MTVLEMAAAYYPRLWNAARLQMLVVKGRLSAADYETVTGEACPVEPETVTPNGDGADAIAAMGILGYTEGA